MRMKFLKRYPVVKLLGSFVFVFLTLGTLLFFIWLGIFWGAYRDMDMAVTITLATVIMINIPMSICISSGMVAKFYARRRDCFWAGVFGGAILSSLLSLFLFSQYWSFSFFAAVTATAVAVAMLSGCAALFLRRQMMR